MTRPQQDIEAGRARLVAATCALIEEQGGRNLSIHDIASRAGMAAAAVERYFSGRDELLEAVAEFWFRPKVEVMEAVVASDLPPRRKMFEFFAQRYVLIRNAIAADPVTFKTYLELGNEHFEQVRSYVDLADHYLGTIIAEAMGDGAFAGLEIDETISLVNQMVSPYCNPDMIALLHERLSEDKLARIIDALFDGLSAQDRGARGVTGLRAA